MSDHLYIIEQQIHGAWEHSGQIAVDAETAAEIAHTLRCVTADTINNQPSPAMREWMRDHSPSDYRVTKIR
jgi:hypothetical protein